MDDLAISVSNVSKRYYVYENQRTRLRHALWPSCTGGVSETWALRDVSFEVRKGEAVGIIGRNGSGKSTLLEIITGTLRPTSGSAVINGRVAALLELGSGFNPEYTGRENVFLNGMLMGLTRAEVESRFDEIAAFADIGDVLDRPVKTYSSGMLVRLAFAVQVALDPDILIVDEALSVGDIFFQQKCYTRMRKLLEGGVSLLFVSHDLGIVRDLCSRAVYLKKGRLAHQGESARGIQMYLEEQADNSRGHLPVKQEGALLQSQEGRAHWSDPTAVWNADVLTEGKTSLLSIFVLDKQGVPSLTARVGEQLRFRVIYCVQDDQPVHVSVVLKNRYDQIVNCTSTYTLGLDIPALPAGTHAVVDIDLDMVMESGSYSFMCSLGFVQDQANAGCALDESPWLGPLTISWDFSLSAPPFYGMFGLPARAEPPRVLQA